MLRSFIFKNPTLCFCSALMLGACTNFEEWNHDAPHIRDLQKQSMEGVAARPIAGQSIEEFFLDKVGLIASAKGGLPSGRAVPISSDGYFLTAWHVVDEGEFHLSDFVQLKPFPKEGVAFESKEYYRVDKHLGRAVWKDEKNDLAIVKFDYSPRQVFRLAGGQSAIGSQVFSAALGTNSGSLVVSGEAGVSDGVGNGPYQTAGTIFAVKAARGSRPASVYRSSLVARGGMSGGAVVNGDGLLVGVLTYINSGFLSPPTTAFSMLEAAAIQEIIAKDRMR
ncbi:MAG: S1 family peptidase [Roseibacillus sp.]